MNRSTVGSRYNLEMLETLLGEWMKDPQSVSEQWRSFFEGFELGLSSSKPRKGPGAEPPSPAKPIPPPTAATEAAPEPGAVPSPTDLEAGRLQFAVTRLINSYRELGHFMADLDPLHLAKVNEQAAQLDISNFDLKEDDLDRIFYISRFLFPVTESATLNELVSALKRTYCGSVGVEFMHIQNTTIRRWLLNRMEPHRNIPNYSAAKKKRIHECLGRATIFEKFLGTRFGGEKRFSLEGAEALIPMLDGLIVQAGLRGVKEIVIGMPHRGRLNVLNNVLHKPVEVIFREFEGIMSPELAGGDGDVKYHLGFSSDYTFRDPQNGQDHLVHLTLTPNPSHLEAVDPVVEGRVRAKQRGVDSERKRGLPLLIHGDAAFAGQGLVAETLNLSRLTGYRTGGTIHIVVNNQIGFTTNPIDSRSTPYCTDVAKMIGVPIFHVNGDDPEAVVYVAELAADFRQEFGMDVVIDMVCYRLHGHNEGDLPDFTQPIMYRGIKTRPNAFEEYSRKLIENGVITPAATEELKTVINAELDASHARKDLPLPVGEIPKQPGYQGAGWTDFQREYSHVPQPTGVPLETLRLITDVTTRVPSNFRLHPTIQKQFERNRRAISDQEGISWGFAETLAYGSLMLENIHVRLSGQDSRRGTFSHRHSTLFDQETEESYTPLNHIRPGQQENFRAYDSMLSEAAVLGFEFGYSLDAPNTLVIWEAQFGDFANGAQVIIDQFIASSESKWGRGSGIVLFLPHGYEGQGPEHSSARLERFLQICADENIQVANVTTPAQFFHLIRRQMLRKFRKPLVVMTPKSLLRHPAAVSTVEEFTSGHFREVLDDPKGNHLSATRILICSGKVYYDLLEARDKQEAEHVAIVRFEQFYPWPEEQAKEVVGQYTAAKEWVWVQEESQNMGAGTFMMPRLRDLPLRNKATIAPTFYVTRDASASPATGSIAIHRREQAELIEAALWGKLPHLVKSTPTKVVHAISRPVPALAKD